MNVRFSVFSLVSIALSVAAVGDESHWYKGNTHTYALWSDGDDLPESVADWYKDNGYNFLVLSDRNIFVARREMERAASG